MNWLTAAPLDQLAPAWAGVKLGTCSNATIGSDGCLAAGFSLLAGVTPLEMNEAMKANGGFYRGCLAATFDVQRLGFPAAPPLVGVTKAYQSVAFPATQLARVLSHVRAGNPAIACIDRDPTTAKFDQHWIALVGAFGTPGLEDFVIDDPLGGVQTSFLARYRSLSRALVRVVLYGTTTREPLAYSDGRQIGTARVEVK